MPTSRLLPARRPSWGSGVLVTLAAVAATTVVAYPLKAAGSALVLGVVYLPAVLIVATRWGFSLGVLTSVLSAAAMDFFHLPPTGSLALSDSRAWVALAGYLVVGALASYLAEVMRGRQQERDAILASVSQPIYVATPDGVITFANAAAVRALGFDDPSELAGQNGHWLVHYKHPDGSTYPIEECPLSRARETGESLSVDEDWWVRRDGSMVAVSYTAAPIQTSAGYGLAIAFSDVGERRAAEQARREWEVADAQAAELAASEERQRAVLDSALDCVISIDGRGRITYFNAAAERTFGCRSGEVIGRELAEVIVPPSVREEHRRGVARHLATGEQRVIGRRIELNAMRSDRSEFPVELTVTRVSLRGEPIFTGYLRDITERRQAEAELDVARRRLQVFAEEQAALRRVATLVAQGAPPGDVFAAVAAEVAQLLGIALVVMSRYELDASVTVIGSWSERPHPFQTGTRWPLEGPTVSARVRETGRPMRVERYTDVEGAIAEAVRGSDMRAAAGAPIVVAGEVWGVIAVAPRDAELPELVEERLAGFTELVGTAIGNTQAREELRRLAEEQAALRRVATLVAHGAAPADVFAAVAAEVAVVLDLPLVEMCRYEPDGTATVIGAVGDHPFQTGTNWTLDGPSLAAQVKRTGRPARVDDYADVAGSIGDAARAEGVHAGVGAPIVVDGNVWGVMSAGGGTRVPVPPGAEARLSQFTELVATAISNSQAREDLQRLADEQAALRRLATLVAEGAEPRVVFDAVAEETGRLLGSTTVNLAHFTPDAINVTISGWSLRGVHVPPGERLPIDGDSINAIVLRTARPGRCDTYEGAAGRLAAHLRRLGIRSEVGAPVVVEGHVWGALIAGTDEPEPLPPGTEYRLAEFAELIATAVANATARSELVVSRARIVQAADEQRRRVVRDLHDGAQQRLVHAVITLQLAAGRSDAPPEVDSALEHTRAAIEELRELAHGIHPALLTSRGLAAAIEALAQRAPIPVRVDIAEERYPTPVESAAYFVAAEALTNVAKYADASAATVTATRQRERLVLAVADDGVGGAAPAAGSGLAGLADRVAALAGTLVVESPPGAGTRVRAEIPLG
jgi:PAS domain S-box-containing protein